MEQIASFGAWLRHRRRVLDMTQEHLAARVFCSPGTIRKIEADERRPSRELAVRLADALMLTLDERSTFLRVARRELVPDQLAVSPVSMVSAPLVPGLVLPPLPHPLQRIIGREQDIERVSSMVQTPSGRLVTLTGTGGVGKTRLAIACAAQAAAGFADGVGFIELVAVRDPALVLSVIAHALHLTHSPAQPAAVTLTQALRHRRCLLVLDNFEHLLPAAPEIASLLTSCPHLVILATSRALLQVRGEQVVQVAPLALPSVTTPVRGVQLAAISNVPAIALFLERAQALNSQFVLTPDNAATLVAICRRLDGLPLALELAAARVSLFSLSQLLFLLNQSSIAMPVAASNLPQRQRTLRDTIDWSYAHLTPGEQVLFARMSVFTGGATLEYICLVCADAASSPLLISEHLNGLVHQSLVQVTLHNGDAPWFSMLETIREYAWECLERRGETNDMQRRHAQHYCELAEHAHTQLNTPAALFWLDKLEREHGNLRAALAQSLSNGDDTVLGARLAGALRFFWRRHGHWNEGRAWLRQARTALEYTKQAHGTDALSATWPVWQTVMRGEIMLAACQCDSHEACSLGAHYVERARAANDPPGLASALDMHASALHYSGAYTAAATASYQAVKVARTLSNPQRLSEIIHQWGIRAIENGDWMRAEQLYAEYMALAQTMADPQLLGRAHMQLAAVALGQQDYQKAERHACVAVALFQKLNDTQLLADVHHISAQIALAQGDVDQALKQITIRLGLCQKLGQLDGIGFALDERARIHTLLGDYDAALADFAASIQHMYLIGDRVGLLYRLEGLSELWAARGDMQCAARLCGAVHALFNAEKLEMNKQYRDVFQQTVERLKLELGEHAFTAAWVSGSNLALEAALQEAGYEYTQESHS